jgi:uncharacterized DUF497 family protein
MMPYYRWDPEKNGRLKADRGVSFEEVVLHIEQGDLLSVYDHPSKERYPGQQILVVRIGDYAYLVPFVESAEGRFLKTIIPSRKATRDFLGEET